MSSTASSTSSRSRFDRSVPAQLSSAAGRKSFAELARHQRIRSTHPLASGRLYLAIGPETAWNGLLQAEHRQDRHFMRLLA